MPHWLSEEQMPTEDYVPVEVGQTRRIEPAAPSITRCSAILPRYVVSKSGVHPDDYGNMVRIEDCQALLDRSLTIINNAIMHGMPVTEDVADVSNLIRGIKWSGENTYGESDRGI